MFHPGRGEMADPAVYRLCASCPVREECLEHALHHEDAGIWAGTSAKQRRTMRSEAGISLRSMNSLLYDAMVHGTPAGYVAHKRRGTEPCDECRHAYTLRARLYRHRSRVSA